VEFDFKKGGVFTDLFEDKLFVEHVESNKMIQFELYLEHLCHLHVMVDKLQVFKFLVVEHKFDKIFWNLELADKLLLDGR
jgi:hypothetical protein